MSKLLSIIVPTYNMENYLQKCLSSVIINDQILFNRFEVIVVNDGSQDSSSIIAHSFERQYPGVFKVIDKENGNYGSCINAGIPIASGKYVKILDADDSFDSEQFFEYLSNLSSIDVDLVINNKVIVNSIGEITEESSVNLTPYTELGFDQISQCYQALDIHKMAYRRTLLLDMKYQQSEHISYSDTEWTVLPFSNVKNAVYFPNTVYRYLVGRVGQTMDKTVRSKSFKSLTAVEFAIGDYMKRFHSTKQRELFIHNFFVYSLIILYREYFFNGFSSLNEFRKFDSELNIRYPEIKPAIDNHQWVTFIPNLHLIADWRENRKFKFYIEYLIIRQYLFWSKKRHKHVNCRKQHS